MIGENKILKNTFILYVRMFISLIIGLISTRVVLNVLGVEDYGIFNLIGGVIAMISFINSAMAGTTQRFLAYNMGKSGKTELQGYFQNSLIIHFSLGLVILFILILFGPDFIRQHLNIPAARIGSAIVLFYYVIIRTFISVITSPYDGSLSSNEDFSFIAITELFLSVSMLLSAIMLIYFGHDKLILYGLLTTLSMFAISVGKIIYCRRKYQECQRTTGKPDKAKLKEMLSFAGWNLFGAGASLANGQGIAVLLNMFHGVVINAAYGVANQISGQLQSFASIISRTISPQLIQAEGLGNRERMFKLSELSSKLAYLLMAMIAIPSMAEMNFILKIWLKSTPEGTLVFANLSIIFILFSSLSNGLIAAVQSIGNIKIYQSIAGSLLILGLPTTFLVFRIGAEAYYAIIVALLFEIITHLFRLAFLFKTAHYRVMHYILNVDIKLILATFLVFAMVYFPTRLIVNDWVRLAIVISISAMAIVLTGYFLVSTAEEKLKIQYLISQIKLKIKLN